MCACGAITHSRASRVSNIVGGFELSHNRLTRLPEEISQLRSLAGLSVAHNTLSNFPTDAGSMKNLLSLNLSHNMLGNINLLVFK